jgi:PKD repeat protein
MGRKGRLDRRRVHRVREHKAATTGPSRTTVQIALGLSAIVAIALMTVVVMNPGWYTHDDSGGTHIIHPNPNHIPPIPVASAIPSQVLVGENITFDGSSSHAFGSSLVVNYTWEFHKQNLAGPVLVTKHDRKFNFSYDTDIIFYVVLTIRDDNGLSNSTITKTNLGGLTVIIRNKMPIAEAGPDVLALVGVPLHLDGTKSYDTEGKIVNYTWDFGDGKKGYGAQVNHTYTHVGSYYAMLTVLDDKGFDNWDSVLVDVKA